MCVVCYYGVTVIEMTTQIKSNERFVRIKKQNCTIGNKSSSVYILFPPYFS